MQHQLTNLTEIDAVHVCRFQYRIYFGNSPSNKVNNPKEDLKVMERDTEIDLRTRCILLITEAPKMSHLRLSLLSIMNQSLSPQILSQCTRRNQKASLAHISFSRNDEEVKRPYIHMDQTSRYTADYNHMTANRIDVIDMACEEYSQEVLGFSDVISSSDTRLTMINRLYFFSQPRDTPSSGQQLFSHSALKEADSFPCLSRG
ncbi:hypothetical protein Tco_0677593 [Tanacetum coccineum]|uniref:Uncharacterized protein n=1 Tax=Tanacetum coccineum TaxID=301880 RepID=A0ABQ4XCS8_9ASTR